MLSCVMIVIIDIVNFGCLGLGIFVILLYVLDFALVWNVVCLVGYLFVIFAVVRLVFLVSCDVVVLF